MTTDPTTPDRDRRGADLLARIDELTSERKLADYPDGNGWRYLLLACKREIEDARKAENTQCDLRYMETEHRERLEQFVRSLLNPEELGHAVPAHVRDAARVALGMQAVESATIEACDGSCVTVNAYCPECDRHTKHVMVSDTVRVCLTCCALSADLTT